MKLLALDTAAEQCSVALWLDGVVIAREALAPPTHAERILPMIDAVLGETRCSLGELDAIAFGRGPGAFTGVRLAASVAQGLAFGAELPVIAISDLQALAQQAFGLHGAPDRILVCQDARMAEVYWAWYRYEEGFARLEGAEHVGPIERVTPAPPGLPCWGTGSGFTAHPELAGRAPCTAIHPLLKPHAREIAVLAAHAGLSAAQPPEEAIPVYLRDDVAWPSHS